MVGYDLSTRTLIAANLISVLLAIILKWSIYDVMLVYWFQSVSIGIFTFYKLCSYPLSQIERQMADEGLEVNDVAHSNPKAARLFIAGFFAVHYGLFHLVYIIFIVGFAKSEGFALDLAGSLVAALCFLGNHYYSYRAHKQHDVTGAGGDNAQAATKIADLFNGPYARIVPIHLTIMVGAAISHFLSGGTFQNTLILVIFMVLKTIMDVMAHSKKHGDTARK